MSRAGTLLLEIIAAVGEADICILHGYEAYPDIIQSDVDIVVSPKGLRTILNTRFAGWRIVQCLIHESSCFYFVYSRTDGGCPEFLALDAALDCRRDGCVFYGHKEILARAQIGHNNLPIPPPSIEFGYYVTKKIGKSSINERQAERLSKLWHEDPAGCLGQLSRFLPARAILFVVLAAKTGNWQTLDQGIGTLRRTMRRHLMRTQPSAFFGYYFLEIGRALARIRRPTGMVVACLGPDGAGKSTLIGLLEQYVGTAFRSSCRYHLRVGWGRRVPRSPTTNPHAHPPRSLLLSLMKLTLWVVEGSVGYIFCVWPRKVRSTLILFDRFFHDLLVDPRRYRYGAPIWLARGINRLVIIPDVFFVLDAPIDILLLRKQEVSPEEASRQRDAYRNLAGRLPTAHVLDASKAPEQVAIEASSIILDYLAERTAKRLSNLRL